MKVKTAIFAVVLFVGLPVQFVSADIFQYTDEDGVIHFTNVNASTGKKYKKAKSEPAVPVPGPVTKSPSGAFQPAPPAVIPQAYGDIIDAACDRHGVDRALVHALVKVESDFNPYALSRKGAMGLMQLMPQTAVNMNVKNSFNPNDNVDGGVKYLRYLLDRYEGNLSLALAAYNAGESAIRRWGTVPPFKETQSYVQRILKMYQGTGKVFVPRNTIFVGYSEDGALMITDDPYKHQGKNPKRKAQRDL